MIDCFVFAVVSRGLDVEAVPRYVSCEKQELCFVYVFACLFVLFCLKPRPCHLLQHLAKVYITPIHFSLSFVISFVTSSFFVTLALGKRPNPRGKRLGTGRGGTQRRT